MSIRYIAGNYIDVNTLSSVSTESTLYKKEFMYDARQAKPWRMTAKTGNAVFDMGALRPTAIGILNHSLTAAATITLEFSNDPPNWGAPADCISLTWHTLNIWKAFSKDYRWLRLVVADAGNPYYLSFGEIVLYTYGSFTRNYNWKYSDTTRYIKSDRATKYGQRWRSRLAKGKGFSLNFDHVTDAHVISEIEAFFEAFDGVNPFIFIPEHTGTDCWYVECLNDLAIRRNFLNMNSFRLVLEEQTRGIEML